MRTLIGISSFLFGVSLLIISGVLYLQRQDGSDVYWRLVQVRNDEPDYYGYYLISPDGQIQRRIHSDSVLSSGRWFVGNSSDGKWIFYTNYENNRNRGLWRMQLNGTQREQLIDDIINLEPYTVQWSPDKQWMAISTYSEQISPDFSGSIYLVRHDGEEVREITTPETGEITSLGWSFDSEWVIYYEQREDGEHNTYEVRIDGTERQPQGQRGWLNFPPLWSPDGRSTITREVESNEWLLHRPNEDAPQILDVQNVEDWLTNDAILATDYGGSSEETLVTIYRYDIPTNQRTIYVEYTFQRDTWWRLLPTREWIIVGSNPEESDTVLYSIHLPSNTRYDLLTDGRRRISPNGRWVSSTNNTATFPSFDSIQFTEDGQWIFYDTVQNGQHSLFKMHPDGTDHQSLYTMPDSPYGWLQFTPNQDALLVYYQEYIRGVNYGRLAQIQIEDGAVTLLPEGEFLNFLPVVETAWAGTGWFAVGLVFTIIPLLLGISEQLRSRTEEKIEGQPMFWIAPSEISIFPMWTDNPVN